MNNKKQIIFTIIIILIFSYSKAPALDTLSLPQAIEKALERNYSIRIAKIEVDAAENNVSPGVAGMIPTIDASGGYSYSVSDATNKISIGSQGVNTIESKGNVNKSLNAGLNLNWTLFDGTAMFINYDRLELLSEMSAVELQIQIENMIRNLASAFFDAATLKLTLDAQIENLRLSRERLERVRDRADFGAAVSLAVLQAEVDLNADSSQFLQTKLAYANAKRSVNFLLGRNPEQDFAPDEKVDFADMPPLETLRDAAMKNNTSINSALKREEASSLELDLINASLYPRLNLSAGYSFSRSESDGGFMQLQENKGFNVGLQASVNLFNGFRTRIQKENARLNIQMSEIAREQVETNLLLSIGAAYDSYQSRKVILELERRAVETANANFERTRDAYRLGGATSVELRQAQLNLLFAKNAVAGAQYELKIAETELLLLSGTLLE